MHELAQTWHSEATLLRRRGAALQAEVLESCATDLEAWVREHDLEALTLEQAATESGYSYSALQKKVADGELTNVGKKHAPRIRRGDLPRKTARPLTTNGIAEVALAARIRRVG